MQPIKLSFCHHVENLNASLWHLSLISTLYFLMLRCQALIFPSYGYNFNHLKTTWYTEYLSFKTRRKSSGGDSRVCGYHRPKLKMTRASTGDLAVWLLWLLMDKGSFFTQRIASTLCGYGNRIWMKTTFYWQTHY